MNPFLRPIYCVCGVNMVGSRAPPPELPDTPEYHAAIQTFNKASIETAKSWRKVNRVISGFKRRFKEHIATHINAIKSVRSAFKKEIGRTAESRHYKAALRKRSILKRNIYKDFNAHLSQGRRFFYGLTWDLSRAFRIRF